MLVVAVVGLQTVAGGRDADAPLSSGTLFDGLNRDTISAEPEGVEGDDYAAGEVLTIFSREVTSSEALEALAAAGLSVDSEDLNAALASHDFCVAHTVDSTISVGTALQAIKTQDADTIQYAEANYYYSLIDNLYDNVEPIDTTDVEVVSEDAAVLGSEDFATFTTKINDPYSYYQWHLDAINAYDAWDIQKVQDNPVSVAVLDTGIMTEHEDLKDRIVARYNATGDGGSVEDADGHGTHVAGIIAATSNNGIGLSGVTYNANLMPVRVFEAEGGSALIYLIRAYEWLLEDADGNGVADKVEQDDLRVVNMSLGGYGQISNVFHTLIQKAYDQGILTVCAAGNDSVEGVSSQTRCWPADYEPSMSVIALDQGISRAYYSNYGSDKDIAAPGTRICSTYLSTGSNTSTGGYAYMSGSSMASPVVAGVAALVYANGLAVARQNEDEGDSGIVGYNAEEVREILEETAMDIGDPGYDIETAWGCVDAAAALKASTSPHTVTINAGEHATLLRNGEEVAGGTATATAMPGETLTDLYTVRPDEGYEFVCFVDDSGDGYTDLSDYRIFYDVTFTAVSAPREDTVTTLELALTDETLLEPNLVLSLSESVTVTVDWGDSSAVETISDGRAEHKYASTGDYLVSITLTAGGSYMLGDGTEAVLSRDYAGSLVEVRGARNAIPNACSFAGCKHLVVADLSNCSTAGVTDMSSMFEGCGALVDLTLPDSGLDTSAVTSMQSMFAGCHSLTSIDLTSFDTSNVTSMEAMFQYCPYIETLDFSSFDTRQVVSMACCFQDCDALGDIKFSKNFKTSNVTDITRLFYGCTHLPKLDLSHFDTSKVEFMTEAFTGCQSLEELDLSSFDTSHVIDMTGMLSACTSLTSLDFSGFDTSRVTSMDSMFAGCYKLSALDLSQFNTFQVTDVDNLFQKCRHLTSLNLSGFDTSNVIEMQDCFYGCIQLRTLILGDGFSFCGGTGERLCSIPSELILPQSGDDMVMVEWEDEKTGVTYSADEVPNNVAATYSAQMLVSDSGSGSSDGSEDATDDVELDSTASDSADSIGDADEVTTEPGPVVDGTTSDLGDSTDNDDNTDNGGITDKDGNVDNGNNAGENATGDSIDSSNGAGSGSTGGGTGSEAAKKQTIKLSKTSVKVKRGGKQLALRASGVKTKLACKANKTVEKALKIKVRGKNRITIKATKKAQRGKTYQIKIWAGKGSNYRKSNIVTLRVKVS